MKSFFIKTLGCKTNQFESQIMAQNLVDGGFIEVNAVNKADFYILNSCSVTSRADSETYFLLHKAKRQKPDIVTVLCGCVAQTANPDDIKFADIILGNHEKQDISRYLVGFKKSCFAPKGACGLNDVLACGTARFETSDNCKSVITTLNDTSDIFDEKKFNFHLLHAPNKTRVSIKIQDGCDNRCSYCTIPLARGNSRSSSAENIILQIEEIAKTAKEVVLTGIHIGQWGKEWGLSLLDLLKNVEKTPILRYRLGSLYTNEINDELINFLKKSEKFCPHFHLSLQSMCDKTLKNMNRNYTTDDVFKVVEKLKFNIPAFLGCDIITGFPNETDEDFEMTFENLKKLNLSKIHVFPYSRRKGTQADKMDGQIQDKVKTKRSKRLLALSDVLYKNFIKQNLGQKFEFLFEKKSPKTGLNIGTTRNYIKAHFNFDENLQNQIRILELREENL